MRQKEYYEVMNTSSLSRTIWGVGILAIGIGFLLDALNVLSFNNFMGTWWPLLLIVGGLAALIGNPRQYLFPVGFIVVGVLLQLDRLKVIDVEVGALIWPAIIILVGLSLLFRQGAGHTKLSNDDESDMFAALAGIDTKVTSQTYAGGKATAVMAGISLDLRQANIKDVAQLDLFTFWGGIELKVPSTWRVHVAGTPLMGGWENKAGLPDDKKAPVLNINATCIMGGVEIKN